MASGVEMLGQMSETEALAGPVQGGNMVVKPNEVPVGGAAMLAKALRGQANKGIGGIYELPSQKAPTPEFMQMAKAGLRQGDPMRGMGPRKGLTAYDMANMAGAVEQAGIINFLGEQPEVTAPIRAKSHADAPPTQLAYITDAEKQMLLDANMHGSLEGNQPNQGPAGIQSLDDFYNTPGGGVGGGSGEQVDSAGSDQGGSGSSGGGGGYESSESVGINPGMAVGGSDDGTVFTSTGTGLDKEFKKDEELTKKLAAEAEQKQEDLLQKLAAEQGIRDREAKKSKEQKDAEAEKLAILNKGEEDMTSEDRTRLTELNKLIASFSEALANDDSFSEMLSGAKDKTLEKLKELGIIGPEIKDIKDLPKETQDEMMKLLGDFERVSVSPKEAMSPLMTTLKGMGAGLERLDEDGNVIGDTLQGLTKKLRALDTGDGASVLESLKKYRPELYYKAFREPQTTGALADFGKNTLAVKDSEGNYTVDGRKISNEDAKRYNNAIFDARERTRDDNNNNQFRRPGVMQDSIAEEVIETPDGVIDEEAQTMKYTSPRTGDKEIDVPLQRRFRTDPTQDVAQYRTAPRTESDILKYMTQGTTGEGIGLEPFSEYQRRRRKAMGLDPLELYG
jgi:Skp family chaperone for outer membrane proteins/uncharacterized membrane protein YgcG